MMRRRCGETAAAPSKNCRPLGGARLDQRGNSPPARQANADQFPSYPGAGRDNIQLFRRQKESTDRRRPSM
jgi:hypothetical protein